MSEAVPDLARLPHYRHDAYEWLLADHPWAAAERRRRAADRRRVETTRAAQLRQWSETR